MVAHCDTFSIVQHLSSGSTRCLDAIEILIWCMYAEQERRVMALQGEVMACGYEDVQVMWSMLDMKSKPTNYDLTS